MANWLKGVSLKGALAFYLATLAFILVVFWMIRPPPGDGNAIALLAGFVTLIVKMAADAVGYQFQSSAGSDKKSDLMAQAPAIGAPAVAPWWSVLTGAEKDKITAEAASDPQVAAFVTTASAGHATADDLAYLVSKTLLTPARASEIERT